MLFSIKTTNKTGKSGQTHIFGTLGITQRLAAIQGTSNQKTAESW